MKELNKIDSQTLVVEIAGRVAKVTAEYAVKATWTLASYSAYYGFIGLKFALSSAQSATAQGYESCKRMAINFQNAKDYRSLPQSPIEEADLTNEDALKANTNNSAEREEQESHSLPAGILSSINFSSLSASARSCAF